MIFMSINNTIAAIAENCIGKTRNEVECSGTHAWCANFVSHVLKRAGIDMWDLSCTSMQNRMSKSDEWDEPETWPIRGDIIFFDWDHISEERPLDHVGIVTEVSNGIVYYVNGNGSSSTIVTRQTINLTNNTIAYWMRYKEKSNNSNSILNNNFNINIKVLKIGAKGKDVKSLQRLLFADGYSVGPAGDDGDFGVQTEKAVMKFQKAHSLDPDGIVGEKTFKALWGC